MIGVSERNEKILFFHAITTFSLKKFQVLQEFSLVPSHSFLYFHIAFFQKNIYSNMNLQQLRNGFHSTFWVANGMELFERLAFYGSKAVLTVYLANKVGLGPQVAASLAGIFSGVLYSLPIVAGTFVDRYGFRKSLMACFAIFCVGYFAIGLAGMEYGQSIVNAVGKTPYVIFVLLLTAIGGSLIKPCIVGTVAKTTTPDSKSLGYSIYYMLVNIGGAIGPIIALQVRESLGIEFVLVMSSFVSALNLLGTYLFFKEPPKATDEKPTTSLGEVFKNMLMVFTNGKFILFLVIFSGFWIMFWQIFYSFPFFVTEILKFPQFEILETVDAWTIILLSVPLTAFAKRLSPIVGMTLGFAIASFSWLLLAFAPTIPFAIAAMVLFAIGEATQAPRFYEYVADLAPKEQVGTYMGFAFLPVAIGSFVAGPLAGWLVANYIQGSHNPAMAWYILSGIGFGSTALMVLYNAMVAKK
ncbi:MAG: MFS transporter [Ignavibacteria bacterium]|nr:MFS transporter [Ignavibacteria bacterium]